MVDGPGQAGAELLIGRLERKDGADEWEHRGTAFWVHPRYLLTAWHVLQAEGEPPPARCLYRVQGPSGAHRVRLAYVGDPQQDWAVLVADVPLGRDGLPLGRPAAPDSSWRSFGFPLARGANGFHLRGTITSLDASDAGGRVIQLHSEQLQGADPRAIGFSGAPVLQSGRAVAILRSMPEHVPRRPAWATLFATHLPIETLRGLGLAVAPPPIRDPVAALEALVKSAFANEELKRLVKRLPGGDELDEVLPPKDARMPVFEVRREILEFLQRRRMVDGRFWDLLCEMRPRRRDEIQDLQASWGLGRGDDEA